MRPKTTFVVPCFKLAHLLPECIKSILAQSCQDFEVLIMDDCSPDNTGEVAKSFQDTRVKYFRNEPNLGHLANYNKGISLAEGDYIWLISADDRLRSTQILRRYVELMDANPKVGFVMCPGVGLISDKETGVLEYSVHGEHDAIFAGHRFYEKLLKSNSVIAASGMVRRTCYEKLGMFPLDMPYAGDWYLWCLFSLHFDVGYLAEPMVNYRLHELSMTNALSRKRRTFDNLAVLWRIKRDAERAGVGKTGKQCLSEICLHYSFALVSERFRTGEGGMTMEEFEQSLSLNGSGETERSEIRARVYASVADACFAKGQREQSLELYRSSLEQKFWNPVVWTKMTLQHMGNPGTRLRNSMRFLKKGARVTSS